MKFDTIARNWLALNGNFLNFDWSLFTNSGIDKQDYSDFCYYSAGYRGVPELALTPGRQLRAMGDFFTGKLNMSALQHDFKVSKGKVASLLGLKMEQYGTLSAHRKFHSGKSTVKKAYDLIMKYLLNPDNLFLCVQTSDGTTRRVTLPQYIYYNNLNKNADVITPENLLSLEVIPFEYGKNVKQVYMIGSTIYTPLAEEELSCILQHVYSFIIELFSPELLKSAQEFALIPLNECTNHVKPQALSNFCVQIARASAVDMSLNDLMNLLGLNIPNIYYSIQHFGLPTAINSKDEYIQFNGHSHLMTSGAGVAPKTASGTVDIDMDIASYKKMRAELTQVGRIVI